MAELVVHLVRHGRVASHRGDIPITDEGREEVRAAGRLLQQELRAGEEIHFLTTPTRRSRETAETLLGTLRDSCLAEVELLEPRGEWAIRNPDLFLAGRRVEMVSTAEAMADQVAGSGVTAADVERVEFFHSFFRSPDRIGYWLRHESPPGEVTVAVARRIMAFSRSLLDAPAERSRRYVCVTHSPVMRAVLAEYLDHDPGEPEWVERIDLAVRPDATTVSFRTLSSAVRP